jgi:hypothetical protein
MRKPSLLFTALICAFSLFSCNQSNTTEKEQSSAPAQNYIVIDPAQLKEKGQLVHVDTAVNWVRTYQKFMSDLYWLDPATGKYVGVDTLNYLNGFTFRTSDLLAALNVKETKLTTPHIRGYFGIDPVTGKRKIFFVGVMNANLDTVPRKAGKDVYFRTQATGNGLADPGDYVLDLNYPCPTLCPPPDDDGITQRAKLPSKQ